MDPVSENNFLLFNCPVNKEVFIVANFSAQHIIT